MDKKIIRKVPLTVQELVLAGGIELSEDILKQRKWHTPIGLLAGNMTMNEATRAREEMGYLKSQIVAAGLGFSEPIALSLEPLDKTTGETVRDSRVLGVLRQGKGEKLKDIVVPVGNSDQLTKELYERFEKAGVELHSRERSGTKEQESESSGAIESR